MPFSLALGLPLLKTPQLGDVGGTVSAPSPPAFDDPNYVVVVDVDTGGAGDYTSLSAAETAERRLNNALPVAFICRASTGLADASTSTFTPLNWGTTKIEIWQATSDYHNGILSLIKYRATVLIIQAPNFLVDGIQFVNTANLTTTVHFSGINVDGIIRNCINKTTIDELIYDFNNVSGTIKSYNNIAIGNLQASQVGFRTNAGTVELSNCLAYRCGNGIFGTDTPPVVKNCISSNNLTADFGGTFDAASSNNMSSDATAPGANSLVSQSVNFKDAAADDLRLVFDSPGYLDGVSSGASYDYGYDISRTAWPSILSMGPHRGVTVDRARLFTFANAEFLSIADNAALSGANNQSFTFAAMVNLDIIGANRGIAWKGVGSGNFEWLLYYQHASLRFRLQAWNGIGAEIVAVNANALGAPSVGTWYYLVGWYDSITNTLNIQANNNAGTSAAWIHATKPTFNSAHPFEIGRAITLTTYASGRICRAGFWKRVLTAAERTWLYVGTVGNNDGRIKVELGVSGNDGANLLSNLIGYWNLDEFDGAANDAFSTHKLTDNNTVTSGDGPT